ncbi:sugar-binding transcriptional regulator [bacterium]|nr:MAG: sugar-binding transcriptional regulator [bacterium]
MARKPLPVDLRLLSKVSRLYYEQNLTQNEISERLHLSRPKISRLLQQALDVNVVKITVHSPPGVYADLEDQLEKCFHLQEVVVVDAANLDSQNSVSHELGIAAASYFQNTIQHRDIIGLAWGSTLSAMVNTLQPMEVKDAHVVQMIGGLGMPESEVHATSLVRQLTRLLNSKLTLLNAPGIIDNVNVKEVILSASYMQAVLHLFSQINVAYVGIGAPTKDSVVMRDGAIMSQADLDALLKKGAVGDIALRFFDIEGQPVISELDARVIGISLEQVKKIPRVVGVAGGPQKHEVVCAALKGGFIDVLITDEQTARFVLEKAPAC